MLQKERYGWDYFKISTFGQIPNINLKKEVHISGTLIGQNVWTKGNYVIDGDIFIPAGSELTIYDGCIVRINGSYKIKVEGKLTVKPLTQDNNPSFAKPIIFTSDDTTITWNGVYIKNGNAEISLSIFRNSITGIYAENSNLTVRNSVFINNKNYGISASGINLDKTLRISNCIFNSQPIGVYLEFTDTTASIENSILTLNAESGIYITTSGARIGNNYFSGNKYSIKGYSNVTGGLMKIYHNDFVSSSSYHIYLQGQDSEIKYNNINSNSAGISIESRYSFTIINYNNLQGKKYLLRLGPYTLNTDARFNYWGTTSEAEIRNLIFDRNDISPSDRYYYTYGIVDYSNYLSEPVKQAGIKK